MVRKFHALLLIALMLVLPLRALAGVAMPCPMESQGAMQMQDDEHGMPCHDMQQAHCDHERSHGHGGCATCGDCCVFSAGLPVSFRLGLIDPPSISPSPLFEQAYLGFQPEGPERPPRSAAL